MKRLIIICICGLISLAQSGWALDLYPGYAGTPWDTEVAAIMKAYPKGTLGKLADQIIYKQVQPSKELRQRSFAFRDNKLYAVTISFAPDFVSKTGLDHLLAIHQKNFGVGQMNLANAPHLYSYVWENDKTRITFAYAPGKPEYTVLMFHQK